MPYIKQEDRERLLKCHNMLAHYPKDGPNTVGELNFVITTILHNYLLRRTLNYQSLSEVISVLECAKLEFYRQVPAHYEDKKKMENGPISSLDDDSAERMR